MVDKLVYVKTGATHQAYMEELMDVTKKHAEHMNGIVQVAIVAKMLGRLIAIQDQTKWTAEQVMQIVADNIQLGNEDALDALLGRSQGSA